MSEERARTGDSFTIGGSVVGSAIGRRNTVRDSTSSLVHGADGPTIEDLRAAVADLRAQVAEDAPAGAGYELDRIAEELAGPEPDAAVVQGRWNQVLRLLEDTSLVSRVTELITAVFS